VNYTYDVLYRLTGETIAGGAVNGTIGYTYDAVGNRLTRTSTVAPVPAATYVYDNNDRLTTDTYDSNGNTTASGANTYAYDFENHLKSMNGAGVTITSDGDGNRVVKTASGTTTKFLVDDRNLTGYAQVLEEIVGGAVQRVYTYGLNRISQSQASGTSFYEYDGHGNVRLATDAAGVVTDRYDYDAFGNSIDQAGTTANLNLYSGEQFDPNVGFYYLRARYLASATGRFENADPLLSTSATFDGQHAYSYASADPVDRSDPSGLITLAEESADVAILGTLSGIALISPKASIVAIELVKGAPEETIPAYHYVTKTKFEGIMFSLGYLSETDADDCKELVKKDSCVFFSPTPYFFSIDAKDQLQLPNAPDLAIHLNLFRNRDGVTPIPPRPALLNRKWGAGGGLEFVTPYGIFIIEPGRNVSVSPLQ
jgi:RHS repeat-associated protein